MKALLAFSIILLVSCDAVKKTSSDKKPPETSATKTQCPEPGKCSWEYLRGKSLVVKEDGIGMLYPELIDNEGTSVIKFRYHKDSPKGVSDGQYTEEIYFEVRNDVKELSLQGDELQKVKLLYGRMCFCERGSVGYARVIDGKLNYSKNNGMVSVSLDFQNNEFPQVIQNLNGSINLSK